MVNPAQNKAIVRASAIYDFLTVAGFSTPWTFGAALGLVIHTGRAFGLSGAQPDFEPMQMMFANLMGSAVLVWSIARYVYPTQGWAGSMRCRVRCSRSGKSARSPRVLRRSSLPSPLAR